MFDYKTGCSCAIFVQHRNVYLQENMCTSREWNIFSVKCWIFSNHRNIWKIRHFWDPSQYLFFNISVNLDFFDWFDLNNYGHISTANMKQQSWGMFDPEISSIELLNHCFNHPVCRIWIFWCLDPLLTHGNENMSKKWRLRKLVLRGRENLIAKLQTKFCFKMQGKE